MINQIIPIVNWPEISGVYTVVQLEVKGDQYLRFANHGNEYHFQVLERFLNEQEIPYKTMKNRNGDVDIPELQGPGYRVCGMGRAVVKPEDKIVFIGGGRFFSLCWSY